MILHSGRCSVSLLADHSTALALPWKRVGWHFSGLKASQPRPMKLTGISGLPSSCSRELHNNNRSSIPLFNDKPTVESRLLSASPAVLGTLVLCPSQVNRLLPAEFKAGFDIRRANTQCSS